MARNCDYYADGSWGKCFCVIKNGEVSYDTYKELCRYGDTKKCPIYKYWKEANNS